jgi:hypothetical protein
MQVNRIARRPDTSRREFAEELRSSGYPADEWKLTRWESGEHKVHLNAAAALDRVLETDGPVISSAVAYLQTTALRAGRRGPDKPLHQLSNAQLDTTFETLLSGEATGLDWYDVLADERIRSGAYLPPSVWKSLTAQLVTELARAVGPAFALRKRAVSALMAQGNGHVFAAFREFVHGSSCQSLAAATLNLVYGRGRDYNDLAVDTLGDPDAAGSWGAMHAVAAKLSLGHFRSGEVPRIESALLDVLSRSPRHDGTQALLRALPVESQLRVAQSVKNGDLLLRSLPNLQPLASSWRQLVRSVAQRARQELNVAALREDDMLESLVTEALLHPHFEGRIAARITLMASPYRPALASAAIDLLPSLPAEQQESLGEFLVFLVGGSHLEDLTALAQAPMTATVKEYAFLALARIPGPLPASAWDAIHEALQGPVSPATRGAIYAIGMHGKLDEEWESLVLVDEPTVQKCWQHQGTAIFE